MRRMVFEEAAQIIARAPQNATREELIALLRAAKDARPESMELYGEAVADLRRELGAKS